MFALLSAAPQVQSALTVGTGGAYDSIQKAVDACPKAGCVIQLLDAQYSLPREIWIGGKMNLVIEPSPALKLAGTRPRLQLAATVTDPFDAVGTASNPTDPLRPAGWKKSLASFEYNGLMVVDSSSDIRLDGLLLDGGTPQYFVENAVFDSKYDLLFGNVGVNLHHSRNVTVRNCEIRNFFSAIYINDRNEGGAVAPNSSDAGTTTAPGSNAGKMGGHLVERNLIHDNWWAVYDESEWDAGSTFRFNICVGNRNTQIATVRASSSEGDNMAGGFLFLKDVPRAIHRIHNNTIWGSPLVMGDAYFRVGRQHLFYNNIVGGFDALPGMLSSYVSDVRQLLIEYKYWNGNNTFALGVADSNYEITTISSAEINDSAACTAIIQGMRPPCHVTLDKPASFIVGLSRRNFWVGWDARQGTPISVVYKGATYLSPSDRNLEAFPGGGFFDGNRRTDMKLSEERWVRTIPWKSTTAGTAGYFEPAWDDSLVLNAIKGKGRKDIGWTSGSLDIGAVVTNAIDTPSIQGPRSSLPVTRDGATCWSIPMQFDAKVVSARLTSIKAWSSPLYELDRGRLIANPSAIDVQISDSSFTNGSSLQVCPKTQPTDSSDLRIQIDSRGTLASGRAVDFEPAVFLATAQAGTSVGTRSWAHTNLVRLNRSGDKLVAKGLPKGEVRIELRTLDGRLLRATSAATEHGAASLSLQGVARSSLIVRILQGDDSWQSAVAPF